MKFKSIWVIAFFLISSSLSAQQGRMRVTGKVTDGETGEALPGAGIMVKGTTTGTITELNGEYDIMVPGSESVLVFSFLGYNNQEVAVGNQRTINIILQPSTEQLEEVVITTQAKGQIGARQQQINSITVKNVVSKDRLQENPDANAVEAIGRLPGIAVSRSGGEGADIMVRGLEPRYTNITLEGIALPSTSASSRGSNISGISQYILQGVEVYKAITPDMDANSVGGTVNLKLQETPAGLHYNVMAQGGYNAMNSYFGNYKLLGEISNRFMDDKLGMFLTASMERVNRSVHTMSAGYANQRSDSIDLRLANSSLDIINRTKTRRSVTLALDYRLGQSTKLKLYSMYSFSNNEEYAQHKAYGHGGLGSVGYVMRSTPVNENFILQNTFSGETRTDFLNMTIDYGLSYSISQRNLPANRVWAYQFYDASNSSITTYEHQKMWPGEVIPLFWDSNDSLHNTVFAQMQNHIDEQMDKNLTAYMNFTAPFHAGDMISGEVKFGGKYRRVDRFRDNLSGMQIQHPFQARYWYEEDALPWLVMSQRGADEWQNYTLEGFDESEMENFLGGAYDYGLLFDFDKLNATSDWWEHWSDSIVGLGQEVWLQMVGDRSLLGYRQMLELSMADDQDLVEDYYAGYLMSEINIGKWAKLIPGFRYEKTQAAMNGQESWEPMFTESTDLPLTATRDTSATREDQFFLPMVHLRVTPTKFFYIHGAYTKTLSRPDYNAISPNFYNEPSHTPFRTNHQNPYLRAEQWTNYDLQATLHGPKVGLFSVSGFYKTVEDKIWRREYPRIASDPTVPGFRENDNVRMLFWENHPYDVTLKGFEVEWQTSFWYLPSPLKFFTLNLNYTFTTSETKYPLSWIETVLVYPPEGGRPVATAVRHDSVVSGVMTYQPRHIGNASLGFSYKGFNSWLSFQYTGGMVLAKSYTTDKMDIIKDPFLRIDAQLSYDLPVKLPGQLQVMANFANLTNYEESSHYRVDLRYTGREAYGWTVDLGVRYKL
ncbi:MAG: carboxypeptidase-like regulatory domain-containing protein [Bacteroidota bacterium]